MTFLPLSSSGSFKTRNVDARGVGYLVKFGCNEGFGCPILANHCQRQLT